MEAFAAGRIGADRLVRLLTHVIGPVGPDELAVVRVPFSAIAWETFPSPSCGLPGADVGQIADARFALAGGRSLHLQRFCGTRGDVIEAHLDDHDACRDPIRHAVHATRAIEYGALGGLGLGLLGYVLTGKRSSALAVGSLGAAVGTFIGANTPTQARRVFDFAPLTTNPRRQA